ncbi:hypothetical protein CEE69_20540 [Rhodopirellula bahusiensis]|uniref:Uncharacterized protein n=1 Tax=Rhodopirellula bahusiensis TaxID=2014065 RepID=A0A2G1W312_9BACT|nr:hypothetical protein CEE69_20540 [Rhodopirellula bahusiensis]
MRFQNEFNSRRCLLFNVDCGLYWRFRPNVDAGMLKDEDFPEKNSGLLLSLPLEQKGGRLL